METCILNPKPNPLKPAITTAAYDSSKELGKNPPVFMLGTLWPVLVGLDPRSRPSSSLKPCMYNHFKKQKKARNESNSSTGNNNLSGQHWLIMFKVGKSSKYNTCYTPFLREATLNPKESLKGILKGTLINGT